MGCSADDSRVDLPSVSSPLGEIERDAARRSRSSRRRFSFLPVSSFSFLLPRLNCGSSSSWGKTYGSCVEQCGSEFFGAQQDPRSWSNPHPGLCFL